MQKYELILNYKTFPKNMFYKIEFSNKKAMNIKRKAVPEALPTPFKVSKDILGVFDIS